MCQEARRGVTALSGAAATWWIGVGCALVGLMIGTATFFLGTTGLVIAGLGLLLFGIILWMFPSERTGMEWVLFAASFALSPFADFRLPMGDLSVPTSAFFAALAVTITCARFVVTREQRLEGRGILLSLALILIGYTLSFIAALRPELGVPLLAKWLFHSLVFVTLMSLSNRVPHLWIALTLVLMTGALSVYGLFEYFAKGSYELNFYAGVKGTRQATAQHVALVLPLAVGVGMIRHLSWPVRLLVWAATGASLAALSLSYSRGGWVAVVIALVVMALSRHRIEVREVLILSLAAIAVLYLGYLAPQTVQDRFWSSFSLQESRDSSVTNVGRLQRKVEAIKVITNHPFLGIGIGNYPLVVPWYKVISGQVGSGIPRAGNPHDSYLLTWAEGGILAFVGFVGMLYFVTARTLRGARESVGPIGPNVLRGAVGSLVALVTFLFFSDDFNHLLVWTILGLAVSGAHVWTVEGSDAAAERGCPSAERFSICRREASRRTHSSVVSRLRSTP